MPRGPATWIWASFVVGIGLPSTVMAQPTLDGTGCPSLDAAAIETGLEIELVDASEALGDGRTSIALSCEEGSVRIDITDRITDKHVARVVPMPMLDRERVVTLAIAQLVLTSWLELLIAPREGPIAAAAETVAREAVSDAAPPPPLEEAAEAEAPVTPIVLPPGRLAGEVALDAGVHLRLEGENLPTAAATLRGHLVVDGLVIVGARLGAEWGRAFRARGTVDVWTASLGVVVGLRSPSVGAFFVDGTIVLDAMLLSVEGHPNDPAAVSGGTTMALVADAALEVAPSIRADALVIALPLSIGVVAFAPDARVTGEASVVVGGALFSAAIRIAYAPR